MSCVVTLYIQTQTNVPRRERARCTSRRRKPASYRVRCYRASSLCELDLLVERLPQSGSRRSGRACVLTLVAAMVLTDQQIYSHLDKLVVSMLSPVLLDVHFMMDICDEDADDDGG